ncbi:MAG: cation diffusion facilitator family transporter [Tissierellia bacterium]|nr:cation diffusion facilitator family transporter [Tissierellia bacterium]
MATYKISPIHCDQCARRLEEDLARLAPGEDIHIDRVQERIHLPDSMDLEKAQTLLEADKIYLWTKAPEAGDDHHDHHAPNLSTPTKMLFVFFLNLAFSLAEFIFGQVFRSSAILADALHDLGDATSIGLAFFLEKVSQKEADKNFSLGYARFSILGALLTSSILILGSFFMIFKGVPLLFNPRIPDHQGMFFMALVAIGMNGLSAWLLSGKSSANERVLSLHVLEDMLGWVAVLVVSVTLRFRDWYFLDPLLSIFIALFILYHALPEFIQALKVFLNSSPDQVPLDQIQAAIRAIPGVHALRHFHFWSLDESHNVFMVTLFVDSLDGREMERIRRQTLDLVAPYRLAHYSIEVIPDPDHILASHKKSKTA